MPKRDWTQPVPRSMRFDLRVTPAERKAIAERAAAAQVSDTDFVRQLALGQPLSAAPKAYGMDVVRWKKLMVSLTEIGALLREILAIVQVGDSPFASTIEKLAERVEDAATDTLALLERQ